MKREDLELLQNLWYFIENYPNYLSNEGNNKFNKLSDQADEENLVW